MDLRYSMACHVYKISKKLDAELRDYVAESLIQLVMAKGVTALNAKDFEFLKELIVKTFPNETNSTEGYYLASGKSSIPPTGRLYRYYTHYRGRLIKRNLVEKIKPGRPTTSTAAETSESTPESEEAEALLQEISEPWQTVLDAWKGSFDVRQAKLVEQNMAPETYLGQYPIMHHSKAKKLVSSGDERCDGVNCIVIHFIFSL